MAATKVMPGMRQRKPWLMGAMGNAGEVEWSFIGKGERAGWVVVIPQWAIGERGGWLGDSPEGMAAKGCREGEGRRGMYPFLKARLA